MYNVHVYHITFFKGYNYITVVGILHLTSFHSLSGFTINKNDVGLYQIIIENVTVFDAGAYRCMVRKYVGLTGITETIAEFKSELIVFGENHCTVGI